MRTLTQDVKYAFRMFRKSPVVSLAMVFSVGLGLGANIAIFSVIQAVFLKPLPVRGPSELTALYTFDRSTAKYQAVSYLDYLSYRDHITSFSGLAAYVRFPLDFKSEGQTERLSAEIVSQNYFSVVGIEPFIGRSFSPEEDSSMGAAAVAVLGYDFWQGRFGGDPKVVGQSVLLNGYPFTVVGVLPQPFKGTVLDWSEPPQIWIPVSMPVKTAPVLASLLQERQARSFRIIGRLKPGITISEAQAAAQTVAANLAQTYKEGDGLTIVVLPAGRANFWPSYHQSIARSLTLFGIATGMLLLLACSNVANLLLTRSSARQKEFAIRVSLGATRLRMIRQLLTESAVLSFLGIGVAFLIASWLQIRLLAFPRPFGIPLALDLHADFQTITFSLLLCVFAVVIFGVVPALQGTRSDLASTLRGTGSPNEVRGRRSILQGVLVVSQVTISLFLLLGAAAFGRSLLKARSLDLGFDGDNLLFISLDLAAERYNATRGLVFYQDMIERMERIAGVQSASVSSLVPLTSSHMSLGVFKSGAAEAAGAQPVRVDYNIVDRKYLRTVRLRLLEGRDIEDQDRYGSPSVTLINQTLARQFWPQSSPVGKELFIRNREGRVISLQIVGVVQAAKYRTVWEEPTPYMYLPIAQHYTPNTELTIRAGAKSTGFVNSVREEFRSMDPDLPVLQIKTWREQMDSSLSQQRLGGMLLGTLGFVSAVLSLVGLYGVISNSVSRQTRAIGIRMAIGASPRDIMREVLARGALLTLTGTAAGTGLALAFSRILTSQVEGVPAVDLPTFLGVSGAVFTSALLATYLPARRASRVDPMIALRYE